MKGLRKPQVGDPVVWYPEANAEQEPTPGIVVSAGAEAADIVLHTVGGGHQLKPSVRHLSDPMLLERDFVRKRYGAWDYAEWFKTVLAIQESFEDYQKFRETRSANASAAAKKAWHKSQRRNKSPEVAEAT